MDHDDKARKKILILEDSKAQAERLAEILQGKGYLVATARDGVQGLDALKVSIPHLIISDVWMPQMNGYDFCRLVKQNPILEAVPIILLTSLRGTKDIMEGLSAGADYYLTKPYDPDVLVRMVDSITARVRRNARESATVEIGSGGSVHSVRVEPQKILNFLFSTYENLISHNEELARTKRELRSANDGLEQRIREKTLSLEHEIAERNKSHKALKETLHGTVTALSRAVEMRDPYTAGHQVRVGELAFAIGREMGFAEDGMEGIRIMGFLHDIGKIIVPAEILVKPSKLNDYEFLFIKAHCQAGYDILKEIDFPWPVATGVLQHHERLNGSGYPSGLVGEEIAMEARILAVSDVVESMSSHRPYRPALGVKRALSEVTSNKGILYDPVVVEALTRILEKGVGQTNPNGLWTAGQDDFVIQDSPGS